jgi:hypothetical protein
MIELRRGKPRLLFSTTSSNDKSGKVSIIASYLDEG